MMSMLTLFYFLGFYLLVMIAIFSYWLSIFWKDTSTPKNDLISWQIIILASVLWPISLPMSISEKIKKQKHSEKISFSVQDTPKELSKPLLGQILQQAGLVSDTQIKLAVSIQQGAQDQLKIGQIIAQRGWLYQETIDFFAEELLKLKNSQQKQPIGYYLKKSKLLDDQQINSILAEQKEVDLRFGEIAVKKNWLKPQTVEYMLQYL